MPRKRGARPARAPFHDWLAHVMLRDATPDLSHRSRKAVPERDRHAKTDLRYVHDTSHSA